MPEKEDLRIIRTRKLLSNTLLDLMENQSIERISVIDLCNKAMVNRATFYAHFEDKYHLLETALDDLKDEVYAEFSGGSERMRTPQDAIEAILHMGIDFFFENHKHINNIIRCNRNDKLIATIEDSIAYSIRHHLAKFKDTYTFRIPIPIIAHFLSGGMLNVALRNIDASGKYSNDEFVEFARLFVDNAYCIKKEV